MPTSTAPVILNSWSVLCCWTVSGAWKVMNRSPSTEQILGDLDASGDLDGI